MNYSLFYVRNYNYVLEMSFLKKVDATFSIENCRGMTTGVTHCSERSDSACSHMHRYFERRRIVLTIRRWGAHIP